MGDATLPSTHYLPVEPTDTYPLDSLKETISAEKFNRHPYLFSEAGFDVAMVTPILKYRMEEAVQLAAAKEKGLGSTRLLFRIRLNRCAICVVGPNMSGSTNQCY
jgi:hypothetical protein